MTDQKAKQLIEKGVYRVADGCHAYVRRGLVHVCPKHVRDNPDRCRNCKHFAQGYHSYTRHTLSFVCMAKPKPERRTALPERVTAPSRYYAANATDKACDRYEPKDD